jgi:hypothetical protein
MRSMLHFFTKMMTQDQSRDTGMAMVLLLVLLAGYGQINC